MQCEGNALAFTLDEAAHSTGLLIVSGGNEIRSGAHASMARLAALVAQNDFPVFRYDRRGIGESNGANLGFLETQQDISAAIANFREEQPNLSKIIAFGNCDAATALALFVDDIDMLLLANPWVIEATNDSETPTAPPPSAIRSRYWERLKNPRTLVDLFRGKIDFRKLLQGLKQAANKQENNDLAMRLRDNLLETNIPTKILLAKRDATALAFSAAWDSPDFADVRAKTNITPQSVDSTSHSFADETSKKWLENQILDALKNA